jgi:response regulator RpfG family c-di-GMP phosphodiesterase
LTVTTAPLRQIVLIVDDSESARSTLVALLGGQGLELPVASNGEEAIAAAICQQPDLILLDVMMPKMDGFEVCRALRKNPVTAMIPIVMVTALDDRGARLQGIEAGADDFLTKPVDRLELQARVRTTLRLNRYRRELDQRKQVVQAMEGSMAVMQDILSLVDPDAFGQSKTLQARVAKIGEALNYPDVHQLRLAAALSKIGRVVIPVEVRSKAKSGERLTVSESRMLERVPEVGHRLLAHMPTFSSVAKDVLWQDKRFDGTGFPFETRVGSAIPLGARIIHLMQDVLDHEVAGLGRAAAIAVCEEDVGHYDPAVLAAAKLVFLRDTQVERILMLSEIEVGMVTRSNIKDDSGRTLVAGGIVITEALLQRLNYFHETRGLQQPFEMTEEAEE